MCDAEDAEAIRTFVEPIRALAEAIRTFPEAIRKRGIAFGTTWCRVQRIKSRTD
jgi:hypothetical protein